MRPDSSKLVYDGNLIGVTVERWGEHEREIVEHPGAVAIVAVDNRQRLTLVRQRREAVRTALLELPAGTLEEGENALDCARRELQEETGLTGGRWRESASASTRRRDSAASACTSSSPRTSNRARRAPRPTRSSSSSTGP